MIDLNCYNVKSRIYKFQILLRINQDETEISKTDPNDSKTTNQNPNSTNSRTSNPISKPTAPNVSTTSSTTDTSVLWGFDDCEEMVRVLDISNHLLTAHGFLQTEFNKVEMFTVESKFREDGTWSTVCFIC